MRSLLITILTLLSYSGYNQCTYTASNPFPINLTVNAGETLCVNGDIGTTNTSIAVQSGGMIRIYNGAKFTVNGSLVVYGTGKIQIEDCNSKLWVNGTYQGVWTVCEIDVFCDTCKPSNINSRFWKLVWGVENWRDMCCQPPLAIELGKFVAEKDGVNNIVYFQTLSEINVDYFVVQKSIGTFVWTGVDSFPGTNSNFPMWYSTIDQDVTASYYYRLKEVETSGNVVYHPTVRVSRQVAEDKEVFRLNILGQHVDATYKGIVFVRYASGKVDKVIQ